MKRTGLFYCSLLLCLLINDLYAQDYFSKTYDMLNGNEKAYRIFSYEDGFQVIGGGILFDTSSTGEISSRALELYTYLDKSGDLLTNTIEYKYNVFNYEPISRSQDTILSRMYRWDGTQYVTVLYFRDQYGDSLYVGIEQEWDSLEPSFFGLQKVGDTIHSLIITDDDFHPWYGNIRGYYQKMDIHGNVLYSEEIVEPSIVDYPLLGKEHFLVPRELHVFNDGSRLISYRYSEHLLNDDGELTREQEIHAILLKKDKDGNTIWKKDLGGVRLSNNYTDPDFIILEDNSIVIPWRREIDKDSDSWLGDSVRVLGYYKYPTSIRRISPEGKTLWNHEFYTGPGIEGNGVRHIYITRLIETANGDIIAIGKNDFEFGNGNWYGLGWVCRMTKEGEVLWKHHYFNEAKGGDVFFSDVVEAADGSLVLVGGVKEIYENFQWNNNSVQWVVKIDENGCYESSCDELVRIDIANSRVVNVNNIWTYIYHPSADKSRTKGYKYNLNGRFYVGDYPRVLYHNLDFANIEGKEDWYSVRQYALRQDYQKVFLYYKEHERETILYDFGMEVGEEIVISREDSSMLTYKVIEVDSILLADGLSHRRLRLVCGEGAQDDCDEITWIQGIGDTRGLLAPIIDVAIDPVYIPDTIPRELLCVNFYEYLLYQHPDYNDCWLNTSVEDIGNHTDNELKVYPNPTRDMFTVSLPEPMSGIGWEIYDRVGSVLMKGREDHAIQEFNIELNGLITGLYFISVSSKNRKRMITKINLIE